MADDILEDAQRAGLCIALKYLLHGYARALEQLKDDLKRRSQECLFERVLEHELAYLHRVRFESALRKFLDTTAYFETVIGSLNQNDNSTAADSIHSQVVARIRQGFAEIRKLVPCPSRSSHKGVAHQRFAAYDWGSRIHGLSTCANVMERDLSPLAEQVDAVADEKRSLYLSISHSISTLSSEVF